MSRPLLTFVERDPGAQVLVVTNMWPDSERPVYGIFVKRQVDSLRAAGVACDVLYLRGYASSLAYPRAALRLAWSSIGWRDRYRVVHVHAGETALAARFHLGTPMIVSYCGDDILGDWRADGSQTLPGRLRARAIRAHSRLFAATITKSHAMHAALPASARRKNHVIPNGIDRMLFRPQDRAEARRRLGWDDDERVVLFAATKPDSPAKRLWLARAAIERAAERIGPIRLHVASGTAPERVPLLMSAADCLLVTSAVEGSPNTVKEALMCNLPVVATPAGDIEERLAEVEPSWVCRPREGDLADALVTCLLNRIRSNGRAVATDLDQAVIAERLISLYSSLAPALSHRPARGEGLANEASS